MAAQENIAEGPSVALFRPWILRLVLLALGSRENNLLVELDSLPQKLLDETIELIYIMY